ncbi:MAG TPA: phospho-N-acetylmuramoyl-pentapeptide-transferase [Lachnospiraceae bacterium]|nr:phospho-N-acetylmuramoyl-pentapeptide-transferase [Lachnospiraceae bacterium]
MVDLTTVVPIFIAFAITAALGPFLIPVLQRLKLDQTERTLGVQSHLKKAGTPTMGGIIFLAGITVTSLIFIWRFPKIGPVLFLMLSFGLLGFLDDYLKVVKKRSDGLFAWQKFLLEFVITGIFVIYLKFFTDIPLTIRLPFSGGATADPGIFTYPLLFFAVIGTVNGVNFTDGLDGLASSVTAVVAVFFTAASFLLGAEVGPISGAVTGALLGFLLFNAYPAKVFMGDTGSLALGGFVIGMAYVLQMPLYILMVGLIYLIEVLSVILQVGYFKISHGKRIFKMAPIHHHFELCGWSETKVVAVFTIVTALLCFLGLIAL